MQVLELESFLERAKTLPVFDVRTRAEFEQGRIPGAHSLPLFNEEERAIVGTLYHQVGKDEAVLKGLEIVGPKLRQLVEQVQAMLPEGAPKEVLVHCWRGGMRSGSVAWLLETAGFKVGILRDGYKSFRRWCIAQLYQPRKLVILGGLTGTGKTAFLAQLRERGEQVIDLEALANHRGSAFGALDQPKQPSNEQFENTLAVAWAALDTERRVWLEDESRNIGRCFLPDSFWMRMSHAPVIVATVSLERRLDHLVEVYGQADPEALSACFDSVSKRLGLERTRAAKAAIAQGQLREAAALALDYYDRGYRYGLSQRAAQFQQVVEMDAGDVSALIERAEQWADPLWAARQASRPA